MLFHYGPYASSLGRRFNRLSFCPVITLDKAKLLITFQTLSLYLRIHGALVHIQLMKSC